MDCPLPASPRQCWWGGVWCTYSSDATLAPGVLVLRGCLLSLENKEAEAGKLSARGCDLLGSLKLLLVASLCRVEVPDGREVHEQISGARCVHAAGPR